GGLAVAHAHHRHGRRGLVHVIGVGAALAAVVIHVQHVDAAGGDHRRRAAGRDGVDDGGLHVGLRRRAPGAAAVAAPATQVAGPQVVEPAVLDEHRDGAVVLVGDGHAPAADDG